MTRRKYTKDSMLRALEHHVAQGRLESFRYIPEQGSRHPWQVDGFNGERAHFTDAQCAALCYGLASAQYGEARRLQEVTD